MKRNTMQQCNFCKHLKLASEKEELCRVNQWAWKDKRPIERQQNCEFFEAKE
jgi:hypothetical protein